MERILPMTYTEAGGSYNGEYYFHYDNFGNTTLLTDSSGNRKYAALYDLNNGKMVSEWNPNSLALVNLGEGETGGITIKLPDTASTPIVFTGEGLIQIDLTYKKITWDVSTGETHFDWSVGGGLDIDDFTPCGPHKCPSGQKWLCDCYYDCPKSNYLVLSSPFKVVFENGCWSSIEIKIQDHKTKRILETLICKYSYATNCGCRTK